MRLKNGPAYILHHATIKLLIPLSEQVLVLIRIGNEMKMSQGSFAINLKETFDHLPNAPIAEAVIHWRARPEVKLEQDVLLEKLQTKLPEYPNLQHQQQIEAKGEKREDGLSFQVQPPVWAGFRFESEDKLQIAQFTRNGFVFSRLKQYEDWDRFEAEAQRLWQIYLEVFKPSEIQRLGVRFINLLVPVDLSNLSKYLTIPPKSPDLLDLPINSFINQVTLGVPGSQYNMKVILTIQPPIPAQTEGSGLIIDIDVYTTNAFQNDAKILKTCLSEMRWLKNKAFFTFLTNDTISSFKDS